MPIARKYTNEELQLISAPQLTAKEIGKMLQIHPQTVSRYRKHLGLSIPVGAKVGKLNLKKMRQVDRVCIGKDCSTIFTTNQASKKKYCSHSCQMKTANTAPKGIGSRKIRNPLIKEYTKYARTVHALSQKVYKKNIAIINPNNYPRTLCGVTGGWQLDHIIPIKECFQQGKSPEEAAAISNLRMLPWHDNLMRQYKE
jgi:5-methylcytosine-specific restriction endonuclease McrA